MTPRPLVSAEELHGLLDGVTLLDVRYRTGGPPGLQQYEVGHVPGAAYVDLDTELADPPGHGGRHPLPRAERFGEAMRRAGVSAGGPVVVYDDWGGRAAARCWWLLRHHGHADVTVLDGGWTAWLGSGGAIERGRRSSRALGDFVPRPGSMPVVQTDDVLGVAVLVDARAPARYRGETEPIDPVAGHVPGAVNVPTDANLDPTGRFRTPEELRARYAEAGAVAGADVAAYCGSGVTACHDVLAMELAGVRSALFPAGWSGWVADPTRPVEAG